VKNRTSGFTLVELMVVVVLVAVVVLVSTQIPLFTFSFWRKGMERLKLQRDANYAMIKIQRELRPAEDSLVSPHVEDEGVEEDELGIGDVLYYVDKTGTSEEDEFFYDLVRKSNGNPELVVKGDEGTDFKVIREGNAIKMTLTLLRGDVDVILTTAVEPRN